MRGLICSVNCFIPSFLPADVHLYATAVAKEPSESWKAGPLWVRTRSQVSFMDPDYREIRPGETRRASCLSRAATVQSGSSFRKQFGRLDPNRPCRYQAQSEIASGQGEASAPRHWPTAAAQQKWTGKLWFTVTPAVAIRLGLGERQQASQPRPNPPKNLSKFLSLE